MIPMSFIAPMVVRVIRFFWTEFEGKKILTRLVDNHTKETPTEWDHALMREAVGLGITQAPTLETQKEILLDAAAAVQGAYDGHKDDIARGVEANEAMHRALSHLAGGTESEA